MKNLFEIGILTKKNVIIDYICYSKVKTKFYSLPTQQQDFV